MGGVLPAISYYHDEFIFIDDGLRNFHEKSEFDSALSDLENTIEGTIASKS